MRPLSLEGGAVPIVVGVTGHRDPDPSRIAALESSVLRFFEKLRAEHPHSPILVLSALAEGADRLVARVALGCDKHGVRGVHLACPLPMAPDRYKEDFTSDASKAEFDELLGDAHQTWAADRGGGATPDTSRRAGYIAVGAVLVQASHVLLALWDGTPARGPGGTGWVVGLMRGEAPLVHGGALPTSTMGGGVEVIPTRRSGEPDPGLIPSPKGTRAKSRVAEHEATLAAVERYNFALAGLPGDPLPGPTSLDCAGQAAGRLAGVSKERTLKAHRTIALASVAVAVSYLIWSEWTSGGLLLLYVVFAGLLALTWRLNTKGHARKRDAIDWRSLAEAARVQSVWHRVGISACVSDAYTHTHHGESAWILKTMRAWQLLAGPSPVPTTVSDTESVRERWIKGQLGFFRKRTRSTALAHRRITALGIGLLCVSVVCAALLLVVSIANAESFRDWWLRTDAMPFSYVLHLGLGGGLVFAALVETYAQTKAYPQENRTYRQMAELFSETHRVSESLTGVDAGEGHLAEFRRLVKELGTAALHENAEWALQHRDREIGLQI